MKLKKNTKILIAIILVIAIIALIYAYSVYKDIFKGNINETVYIFVPTGSDYEDLTDSLIASDVFIDFNSFKKTAQIKKFTDNVRPGKYQLKKGMTNNEIVNMLRSGKQTPVKFTFNNIRTIDELASKIGKSLEADSIEAASLLKDDHFTSEFGFNSENIISMFIPNTYEFYWNTDAKEFIDKMNKEYKKFWTGDRLKKAEKINLTPQQVSVLASIVQAEQMLHNDEKPKIAGLYINRLHREMLLQSDPTLIFASGDFTKKRVLNSDKEIESPYNTYKYAGLPPGPINMPEISSIDAVLNYESHNYIFMCAKEDFSGYHNFSTNAAQHENYARLYRQALNKKKIWK
jgi:UPF0755 protein